MSKTNETNFMLKKVKLNGNKVAIEYSETAINKNGVKEIFTKTCQSETCIPHEDLVNSIGLLREYLMRSMRYFEFYELAKNQAGTSKEKEKVVDMFLDLTQDVTVTGISLSGTGDFASLVITGKIKNQMNGQSAINSPKITLNGDFLGYEDVVANLANTIGSECYAFIYQNKKAAKDLFDLPESDTEETLETKKASA